ncbi:MAG: M48 family metalloprotease [Leptospirillia bacterium]
MFDLRRGRWVLIAVGLAVGLALSGCATPSSGPDPSAEDPRAGRSDDTMPNEAEDSAGKVGQLKGKEIGRQFLQVALSRFHFRSEPEVAGYVERVGRKIAAASGSSPDAYHFFVLDNPQANAFAIPGGYVFIFDGLLKRLSNEEEMAGVLAHEVAHVRYNHFFKDQKKVAAADLAVIAAILLGQGGEAVTALSLAGATSMQLAYSRANEREADIGAMRYLKNAGYDPRGLARFFDVLSRETRLVQTRASDPYLSTHPGLEERNDWVLRMIERSGVSQPEPVSSREWDRMTAVLAAEDVDRRPPTGSAYQRGLAYLHASRPKLAHPLLLEALAGMDSADTRAALSESLLMEGDLAGAAREAARALDHDPAHVGARMVEAEVARREGDSAHAMAAYRKVLELDSRYPMAHFRLSELLNEAGNDTWGAFHLARYLRLTLKPGQAFQVLSGLYEKVRDADPELAGRVQSERDEIITEGV